MPEEAVRDFIKGKAKWGPEPPTEPPTASTTAPPHPQPLRRPWAASKYAAIKLQNIFIYI